MIQSGSTILASLFLTICFVASSSAQSASPETLVEDFTKAWNSHDEKGFDRLFTDDVIFVPVAKVRSEGRNEVVKAFARIHAPTGWAKGTTVTQSGIKVQTLGPDVAVVFFHWDLAGQTGKDNKPLTSVDRAMLVVAVKQSDGWRISAGQVTKPPARAE